MVHLLRTRDVVLGLETIGLALPLNELYSGLAVD